MISFESDYTTGAHPAILKRLSETNLEPVPGYGTDDFCESAKEKIRKACGYPDAQVELLVGGTQTNAVVISAMLQDWQGVVAAACGHINAHESGAVEYMGHKILALPQKEGKLEADVLADYLKNFYEDRNCEHMVYPGMVYISHPTEYGTLYTKVELTALSEICQKYGMPLYMDGARLGYGLMSYQTDVTLQDIADLCDAFYIGGTKVGALCGEAVVFPRGARPAHFMNSMKKRGALLAKGRLLGIQFDTLFTDDLYFTISRHAIDMAEELKDIFRENGIPMYLDSPTNQQFPVLENGMMEELRKRLRFSFWEKADETHTVTRFATSWSTAKQDLEILRRELEKIRKA